MVCGPIGSSVFTIGAGDRVPCLGRHVLTWGPDRMAISSYLQDKSGCGVPLYPCLPIISDPRALTEFTAWTHKGANMLWQQRISDMEMVISTVSGPPSPPRVLLMPLDPHAVAAFC